MLKVPANTLKRLIQRTGFLLLLVLVSYFLALKTEPTGIRNDTVHYVSGARNVLAGHGVSSDIAYYDLQHRLGRLPVPITDWPPGVPLLIAVFVVPGFDGFTSALMVNYLCLLVSLWVVYRILMLRGVRSTTRFVATAMLVVYLPSWRFACDGGSTMPMVFCTLLSFYFLQRWDTDLNADQNTSLPESSRTSSQSVNCDLWMCGVFAGAAFSMRYAGLFFIASLGLFLVIDWIRKRTWESFRNFIRVVIPIVLISGVVLGRNVYHVNSLFGRPKSAINVASPLSEQITWTLSLLSGISLSALSAANPFAIIAAVAVAICIPLCAFGLWASRRNSKPTARLPAIYVSFSIVSLVGCSAAFQFEFVQPRYLVAIVPFVLILLAEALDQVWSEKPAHIARWMPGVLLVLCFTGQLRTYWYADKSALRNERVRTALQASVGDSTIGDLLNDVTTRTHPLLTDRPQEIALVIDRPTIGIATAEFSRKVLTSKEARQMMESFGAQRVFLLKALFDETEPTRSNQVFFADLKNGRIPRWLRTIYSNENIGLYERVDSGKSPAE